MAIFKYLLLKGAQALLDTLGLQRGFTSKERTLASSNISLFNFIYLFIFSFVVEVLFDSTDTSFALV